MTLTDRLSAPLLPSVNVLSEAQVRGTGCVFCGVTLSTETAVDLGPHKLTRLDEVACWFPRACRPCIGGGYVDVLLTTAFTACRALPPPKTLTDTCRRLRHEIRRRLPAATVAAAESGEGSMAWHAHQRTIDASHDALADEAGERPSPLVLAMRVSELGRRLRDLLRYPPCGGFGT
ncbi:DUF6415 family natural product biosynthesis protein [Streptomyces sp. NPDC058308]|uniref:DUF6415 family natural product biosynthesis protein n=1 Tax=Streptomyces sp. NPDC058308 TaxID=3346440 RepID=UPI0036ED8408